VQVAAIAEAGIVFAFPMRRMASGNVLRMTWQVRVDAEWRSRRAELACRQGGWPTWA